MNERPYLFIVDEPHCGHSLRADGLEGGRQAARELLSSGFQPTAILCVNDFMAVGVLRHLRDQGIRVPEDVSVTGFDNIRLAEFCSPALTTVHIPRERIGQTIFGNLVPDKASDRLTGQEILVDPELVVRESTGVARQTQAIEINKERTATDATANR